MGVIICTIIIIHQPSRQPALVIGANRDEFYARPSTPPQQIDSFYAGIDKKAGGSWMGATKDGFIVGITNQRTKEPPSTSRLSRGQLVIDALQLAETQKVKKYLQQQNNYNGFNLLFGKAGDLYIAYGHRPGDKPQIEPVPFGIHVLPNGKRNDKQFFKVSQALRKSKEIAELPWEQQRQLLQQVLMNEQVAPRPDPVPGWLQGWGYTLSSVFVKSPKYGTCSSTIIATNNNKLLEYWFADHLRDGQFVRLNR